MKAAMEEQKVQREKIEGLWEGGGGGGGGGQDGGKNNGEWKNDCSLSSLLKHSCLLCWSSPKEPDVAETDGRVLVKVAEIRELENAVAVESLELQEQQSDRKELQETLVKLDTHKDKLIQQIKATRQLCYEESQQILSLQADEVQKESQVEEYERELARAKWRLKRLKDEVKQTKRKVEETEGRSHPLQDGIRQSYEEILQEEHTLFSLSGSAATPESQLESTSPADTTEDDALPMRPWGRSQSLPAYADLIMRDSSSSFCNNLADTKEEADDSGTSSPKTDACGRGDDDDDADDGETKGSTQREGNTVKSRTLGQLDFYKENPFASCQGDHDPFNEDLFPKPDSPDEFASDPFKGSDPFAADMLYPAAGGAGADAEGNGCDDGDTSLSLKASTGTQCFESEFPDEDSDIEISYSREDLDTIQAFQPIQSSSEELRPEPILGWGSHGQYSVESDPNAYELDLGAISPSSAIDEQSFVSLEETREGPAGLEPGLNLGEPPEAADPVLLEPDGPDESHVTPDPVPDRFSHSKDENPTSPKVSENLDENMDLSFELSYEQTSQSSFDPYGFKLSPEHSSQTLLDPDEPNENDLLPDPVPTSSSQPEELSFGLYDFDVTCPKMLPESDPYGFKLSPEEELDQEALDQETLDQEALDQEEPDQEELDQEALDLEELDQEALDLEALDQEELDQEALDQEALDQEVLDLEELDQEALDLCSYDPQEAMDLSPYNKSRELDAAAALEPHDHENQEVLDPFGFNNQELLDLSDQAGREPVHFENQNFQSNGNRELLGLCVRENPAGADPAGGAANNQVHFEHDSCGNQEVLENWSNGNSPSENREVLDFDPHGNQETLDSNLQPGPHSDPERRQTACNENQNLVDSGRHDNQELLDEPALSPGSDESTDEPLGPEPRLTDGTAPRNTPAHQDRARTGVQPEQEADLGSMFGAGGYIRCVDVADDLEPVERRRVGPPAPAEPPRPVRPVRPPRPSLKAKERAAAQGIDLK